MAKYFDPMTNQVTDYDPRVQGNVTSGSTTSDGSSNTGGETTTQDPLKLIFSKLMMSNPKQISGLKTIYDMLSPESAKQTAEQRNRVAALQPAAIAIKKARESTYEGTGPQAIPANLSIRHLGGLGVNKRLKEQKARFSLLKQNVVRSFQGARMSDQDIKLAQEYIPDITDTPETIQVKLGVLDEVLKNIMGEGL